MNTFIAKFSQFLRFTANVVFIFFFLYLAIGCSDSAIYEDHYKGWQFQSQRPEIAPKYWIEKDVQHNNKPTLALSGDGKVYANGEWSLTIDVESKKFYEFKTSFFQTDVDEPNRCILAIITWQDGNGAQVGYIEFPVTEFGKTANGWYIIRQTYKVPDKAVKAKISLVYRWDTDGVVYFGETKLDKVARPEPRLVRLAAIHHRPENTASPDENLNQFAEFVQIAGRKHADIVCLPEGITVVGTDSTYIQVSEPVPGPTTQFLGKLAKKNNLYIVAGIYEREGPAVYNTAVLLGRDGELRGKYRKTSLPREEIDGGITPGDSFPVFDTDFGRIGLMICWDVYFPEPARMLALKGAEVIFMPIWGGNLNLAKARAIENQIYLVSSTYDMKTGVFDKTGDLLVEGTDEEPVVVVEVDLNKQKLWNWLGEFKNRIPRELPTRKSIKY